MNEMVMGGDYVVVVGYYGCVVGLEYFVEYCRLEFERECEIEVLWEELVVFWRKYDYVVSVDE